MWFARDEGDGQCVRLLAACDPNVPLPATQARQYSITVRTSDIRGAGTDANVFITLVGSAGSSGALRLESSKDDFRRGACDRFSVEAAVGLLRHVRIGHDNGGAAPGWHLQVRRAGS
jgi:hypothetical protein